MPPLSFLNLVCKQTNSIKSFWNLSIYITWDNALSCASPVSPCTLCLDSHAHAAPCHPDTSRDQMAQEGNTSPMLGPGPSSKRNIIRGHLHQQRLQKKFNQGSYAEVQPPQDSLLSVSSGSHTSVMLLLHSAVFQHFLLFFQVLPQSSPWWFKTTKVNLYSWILLQQNQADNTFRAHLYTFFLLLQTDKSFIFQPERKRNETKGMGMVLTHRHTLPSSSENSHGLVPRRSPGMRGRPRSADECRNGSDSKPCPVKNGRYYKDDSKYLNEPLRRENKPNHEMVISSTISIQGQGL